MSMTSYIALLAVAVLAPHLDKKTANTIGGGLILLSFIFGVSAAFA